MAKSSQHKTGKHYDNMTKIPRFTSAMKYIGISECTGVRRHCVQKQTGKKRPRAGKGPAGLGIIRGKNVRGGMST